MNTDPAPSPQESAAETITGFLKDYGSAAGPWGSDTLVMDLIEAQFAGIADAYTHGTLGPDVCFPEDQMTGLEIRMDEVFQARRDQWCAQHPLTGEQLVGMTLVDDAGHQLAVTAVRRDDDLQWAIIGTITCPGCGGNHPAVEYDTEQAWAIDDDLRRWDIFGWRILPPTSTQLGPAAEPAPSEPTLAEASKRSSGAAWRTGLC